MIMTNVVQVIPYKINWLININVLILINQSVDLYRINMVTCQSQIQHKNTQWHQLIGTAVNGRMVAFIQCL